MEDDERTEAAGEANAAAPRTFESTYSDEDMKLGWLEAQYKKSVGVDWMDQAAVFYHDCLTETGNLQF
jgi:hypothetical protein